MGKVVEKILEILQMQAENAVDLFNTMTTDRSTSYRMARRSLLYGPPEFKTDWAEWYRKRQAFHSLLNKLKREGLIKKEENKRNSPWSITKQGARKLSLLQEKRGDRELIKSEYTHRQGDNLVIISFDIPERERRKRDWLRSVILSFGFKKLQKSVWVGKVGIPKEFFNDLKTNGILSYVHIFSIRKGGSIVEQQFE